MQGLQESGECMGGIGVIYRQQEGQGDVRAGRQRHVLGDGALQLGRHPVRHIGDLVRVHQHATPHLSQHAGLQHQPALQTILCSDVFHFSQHRLRTWTGLNISKLNRTGAMLHPFSQFPKPPRATEDTSSRRTGRNEQSMLGEGNEDLHHHSGWGSHPP